MDASTRDNAGRFRPGVSGNPNGRPRKKLPMTDALAEVLDEDAMKTLWAVYVARAKSGDLQAMTLICGYLQGRPSQTIIHEGNTSSDMLEQFRDLMNAATALGGHDRDDEDAA